MTLRVRLATVATVALVAASALAVLWAVDAMRSVRADDEAAKSGGGGAGIEAPASTLWALTDDDRRGFAWFDGLGLPSTSGRPFVLVRTGRTDEDDDDDDEDGAARPQTLVGFLLAEDDEAFTVLTDDLLVKRFSRRPDKAGAAATFEAADLAAHAKAQLDAPRTALRNAPRRWEFFGRDGPRLGDSAELLGLARHCAEHGLGREAHNLVALARALPLMANARAELRPVEDVVADEIATPWIWRHTLAFGDASIPRTKLLDAFRRFVASFPRSEHLAKAQELVATLERMVREDAEHAKTVKAWDATSKDERIAELIWRLRDAPGGQFMQPGSPHFFSEVEGTKEPTALAQLVALGHDAVPALIAALEDRSLTRCVGFWRNFMYSHYVQRVGDAALQALQTIAGQRFFEGTYTAAAMAKDGEASAVRQRVEQWWADFRTKGEKEVLVATVAEGGMNAAGALTRLIEKYPDAAAGAALRGLRVATGSARHNIFGSPLQRIDDPAVTAFVVEAATSEADPACRAMAIGIALERGRLEVLPAAIEVWRTQRSESSGLRFGQRANVVSALVRSGSLEGIAALGERLGDFPPDAAADVASAAGMQLQFLPKRAGYPAEALTAVEDLVVSLLDDTRETGVTSSSGRASVRDRVCDDAAKSLAPVLGVPFKWDEETDVRDRAIAAIRNAWRAKRGLPLVEPPAPVVVARVAEETLRPLVEELIASPGDAAAAAAVEAIGLGALPGVREAAERLPEGGPARAALASIARRIAIVVREARLSERSAPVTPAVAEALAAMQGRPLTSAALCDVFLALACPPPTLQSVMVTATWKPDGTGFAVAVHVARGGAEEPAASWELAVDVSGSRAKSYGPMTLLTSGDKRLGPDDLRVLRTTLDAVLAEPPERAVVVRLAAHR